MIGVSKYVTHLDRTQAFVAALWRALCHVLHLSVGVIVLPESLDSKQQIIIITLHVRGRWTQRNQAMAIKWIDYFLLRIPSFPHLLVAGLFSYLGCLRAKNECGFYF